MIVVKKTGCGPTTACNLLSYIEFSDSMQKTRILIKKEEALRRMQEAWEYVTPTENGIPTIKMFSDFFVNYAKINLGLWYESTKLGGGFVYFSK